MIVDIYFKKLNAVLEEIDLESINNAISLIKNKIDNNKKIITCGNGGSAHTASHYITDWNKSFYLSKGIQFKGLSLCDNLGLVTAYANDISYEEIFSGQLKNIGNNEDLLIVISGSGKSKNVIKALETAKTLGIETLSIIGYDGGECIKLSDNFIHIPSFDMQICEDLHIIIGHIIMKEICGYGIN